MHPSVKEEKPGDCPICGMHLVPVYESNTNAPAVAKTNSAAVKADATALPSCCGISCPMNSKP
jgi:Cu(I)/Ag(I) efflux system membrane fusion protein